MASKSGPTINVTEAEDNTKPEFFPWHEAGEKPQRLVTRIAQHFPVLGGLSLIGSALTVALSFTVLTCFNKQQVISNDSHEPKPAAWLSIIGSLNSILLHIAISQGLNVSWWYRASKSETTVAELHNTWSFGNSVFSAVLAGKKFNYIALATIFVATIPINGILVQSAVTAGILYDAPLTNYSFQVNVNNDIPVGYSARLGTNGKVQAPTPDWQNSMDQIMTMGSSADSSYTTSVPYGLKPACDGMCYGAVQALGFTTTCNSYNEPYQLPDDGSNVTFESTIFAVNWVWNASSPNLIGLNTVSKPPGCEGQYTVSNCTLRMAAVTYGIIVNDIQDPTNTNGGEQYKWDLNETVSFDQPHNYNPQDPRYFDGTSELHKNATTFGGIADALNSYYASSITYSLQNGSSSLVTTGSYAYRAFHSNYTDENDTTIVVLDNCAINTNEIDGAYLTDQLLHSAQRTLLYLSVNLAVNNETPPVTVNGSHYSLESVYLVRWDYWFASLGATFAVIIFIIPTYYGYWTLTRKTTLSPFETARAFQAPVLRDAAKDIPMDELLAQMGSKKVHRDLLPVENTRSSSPTSSISASVRSATVSVDHTSTREILERSR